MSGLEYYVIDGVAAAISKYTLSKKIFGLKIPMPFKIKQVPFIPLSVYAKTYAEAGYAYNKKAFDTRLNNRFLYTGGFGFDILSLYDLKLSVEFSFNQLGEKGLFLHARGILWGMVSINYKLKIKNSKCESEDTILIFDFLILT